MFSKSLSLRFFSKLHYSRNKIIFPKNIRFYVSNYKFRSQEIYNTLLNQSNNESTPCNFITQVVDHWAQTDALAIHCVNEDNREENISYKELVEYSHQIGDYFEQVGVKKGESIALMLGQQPAWWFSVAGLIRNGIAVIPCPRLLTAKDLAYRINDLSIKGIITTPDSQYKIDSIRTQCPSLTTLLTTGTSNSNWTSLNDIFKGKIITNSLTNTSSQDPCLYLYTSGTTGQPKAVIHNQDYPFFHWPTGNRWLQATSEDLVFNASDTGWGFTFWITAAVWSVGAKLLIAPTTKKFDAQKLLAILSTQPITIFCAAPTVLRLLVAEKNFDDYTFSHLKRIVTVGEALDETVINRFHSRGIEVHVGFGQAETPLLIGRVDDREHIPGTMNKAIDPYQVVILDDELKPLPAGHTGQIAVDLKEGSSRGLMHGYANNPEKTQKTYSSDGRYYLTGDWARYREDGSYCYEGRKDDLIKSRGYRIGPDEVEKAGMSHPAVAKIAVVGVRTGENLGITVKAFILLKPQYTESAELIKDIQEHIKQQTAPHKCPRKIEFLNLPEWEKYETSSGKIRRAALREREHNKSDLSLAEATQRVSF